MTPTCVDRYRFRAGIALIIASIDYVDRTLPNLRELSIPHRRPASLCVPTYRRCGEVDVAFIGRFVDNPRVRSSRRVSWFVS
jgi:hypothetical protein